MNEGWWERANNLNLKEMGIKSDMGVNKRMQEEEDALVSFIFSYKDLVHPNVLKDVKDKKSEGFRMALNQIHYGSLRVRREVQDSKKLIRQSNNKADEDEKMGWTLVTHKKNQKTKQERGCIFMAKIPYEAKAKEVWNFLQQGGRITDVTLPRKRDKFQNRIGFVKVESEQEAFNILENLQGRPLLGNIIHLSIARKPKEAYKKQDNGMRQKQEEKAIKEIKVWVEKGEKEKGEKGKDLRIPTGPSDKPRKQNNSSKREKKMETKEKFKKGKSEDDNSKFFEMETNKEAEDILNRSIIGYSYSMSTGDFLQVAIDDLKLGLEIKVAELSSWKFLLTFSSEEGKNSFNFDNLSNWFSRWEDIQVNSFCIKRNAFIECRGVPFKVWSRSNFINLTSDLGEWEEWINEKSVALRVENPVLCIYTENLEHIKAARTLKIGSALVNITLTEIDYCQGDLIEKNYSSKCSSSPILQEIQSSGSFSKVSFVQESTFKSPQVQEVSSNQSPFNYDQSTRSIPPKIPNSSPVILERKTLANEKSNCALFKEWRGTKLDSTHTSCNSKDAWNLNPHISLKGDIGFKQKGDIIDPRNLESLCTSSNQSSICNLLKTIKIKGAGRPRKKRNSNKNPFAGRKSLWPKGTGKPIKKKGKRTINASQKEFQQEKKKLQSAKLLENGAAREA